MLLLSIVDSALVAINIFNAFVLFAHLHPVESPLKKLLLNCIQRVVSDFHSTRYGVSFALLSLLCISTCSATRYYQEDDSAMLIRAIISGYTFACTSIFIKLSHQMLQLSIDRLMELEKEVARHDICNFTPPTKSVMDALLTPYKPFISVESTGLHRIPSNTPHLFVSNHSLYGIEMPLLLNQLYQHKDIFPRGLADHFHFATLNGPIIRAFGAVDGTRENVDALMEKGESVLVYPGGGHEVLKHSSVPRYELMWKQRLGFARCAIKHGYPILPCACVGTEDMFESVCDIPTGYKGMVLPISVTSPCKVQKCFFWFGTPIETKQYNGEYTCDEYAKEVRDKTQMAIEAGIKELKEKQASDPERYTVDQYKSQIRRKFCSSSVSAAVSDDDHSLKED
jgi:1-acyl-sn-glycerol-3-phosphate acyltransferase